MKGIILTISLIAMVGVVRSIAQSPSPSPSPAWLSEELTKSGTISLSQVQTKAAAMFRCTSSVTNPCDYPTMDEITIDLSVMKGLKTIVLVDGDKTTRIDVGMFRSASDK